MHLVWSGCGKHLGASGDSLKQLLCADFVADKHSGDQKIVSDSGASWTIQPSGNVHTWTVQSDIRTSTLETRKMCPTLARR